MSHLLFAVILTIAVSGAVGEAIFTRKKRGAPYELWKRYHKYATWCKVVGIVFALATGFLGGQLYIK